MATRYNYRSADWNAIDAVVKTLTPTIMQAVVGAGWLGWFPTGQVIPPPEPAAPPSPPTLWGRWEMFYEGEPTTALDPDSAPVRQGAIVLSIRYQVGLSRQLPLAAADRASQAFGEASRRDVVAFFAEGPSQRRNDLDAGWQVEDLRIEFMGVN